MGMLEIFNFRLKACRVDSTIVHEVELWLLAGLFRCQ